VIPLLIILACPASMIVMAVMMRPSPGTTSGDEAPPRDADRIRSELADLETRRSSLEAELSAASEPATDPGPAEQAPRQETATR
jgi:hypothetical protein